MAFTSSSVIQLSSAVVSINGATQNDSAQSGSYGAGSTTATIKYQGKTGADVPITIYIVIRCLPFYTPDARPRTITYKIFNADGGGANLSNCSCVNESATLSAPADTCYSEAVSIRSPEYLSHGNKILPATFGVRLQVIMILITIHLQDVAL